MDNRRDKINRDKQLTLSPGFWDDNERATQILKDIKLNEYWVKLYEQVETSVEDFAVLFDFWKAGEGEEQDVKASSMLFPCSRLVCGPAGILL